MDFNVVKNARMSLISLISAPGAHSCTCVVYCCSYKLLDIDLNVLFSFHAHAHMPSHVMHMYMPPQFMYMYMPLHFMYMYMPPHVMHMHMSA